MSIRVGDIPDESLLRGYRESGDYADCYTTTVGCSVTHAEFVTAFYTTWLFKLERWILSWAVDKPSTDEDAARVAAGTSERFAAWYVEARAQDQLLMCDFRGATRSWFGLVRQTASTRLYFGSAIVRRASPRSGRRELAWQFHALLGFHRLYSRALLAAARRRLAARPASVA
jgi:hypothetical protein